MTLMKSLLLGSAATFVVVAGAQAADLPTKKGAPAAEYVKVCKIGSIAGFIVPGTDTCLKLSGLVTGRYAVGATHDVYAIGEGGLGKVVSARQQDAYGTWTRGRLTVDAASNTAYGPLIAHMDIESQFSGGYAFGNVSPSTPHATYGNVGSQVDKAWLTWAGITAGKVESFFDYYHFDGAVNSDMDMFAADNSVNALAYTATFGGGFSGTLSIESPVNAVASATYAADYGTSYQPGADGDRSPDIVVSLDLRQGWGDVHVAGLLHNIRQQAGGASSVSPAWTTDTWGWGINGGVTINLPMLGAGADFKATTTYTDGDYGQSGVGSPWYLNLGGVVNNGATGDIYYSTQKGWVKPQIWTVAAGFDIPLGPQFKISPEASYARVSLSTPSDSLMSKNWQAFLGGATFEWAPVHNLTFDLDLLYEDGNQGTPNGWAAFTDTAWKKNFNGFLGEFRVERDF
jgi:hypothetical protein